MEAVTSGSEVCYCRLSDQVEQFRILLMLGVLPIGPGYTHTEVYLEERKEGGEAIEGNVINPHTFSCNVQKWLGIREALVFERNEKLILPLVKRTCELLEAKELFADRDELARSVSLI